MKWNSKLDKISYRKIICRKNPTLNKATQKTNNNQAIIAIGRTFFIIIMLSIWQIQKSYWAKEKSPAVISSVSKWVTWFRWIVISLRIWGGFQDWQFWIKLPVVDGISRCNIQFSRFHHLSRNIFISRTFSYFWEVVKQWCF